MAFGMAGRDGLGLAARPALERFTVRGGIEFARQDRAEAVSQIADPAEAQPAYCPARRAPFHRVKIGQEAGIGNDRQAFSRSGWAGSLARKRWR